jgi:ribose transport system permease protein
MTTAVGAARRPTAPAMESATRLLRRNGWSAGLLGLLVLFLAFTKAIQPSYGASELQDLARGALPLALAAVAQAIVVISGGIDLSVGPMMALASVTAASQMQGQGEGYGVAVAIGILLLGLVLGTINGSLIVLTMVPDIVVTLAMSFVWAGCALLVLNSPGGGSAQWLKALVNGSIGTEWLPRAFVFLVVTVGVVWIPLRRSRLGISLYAIGSDRLAAFRSGVPVGRTKILAYALTGLFSALGGLALTGYTGIGAPVPGNYTLLGIAAIVLGGVSLAGGRGGVVGPVIAVMILSLIRSDLTFLNVNPNLATVIQGLILIGVVMLGSLITLRRERR